MDKNDLLALEILKLREQNATLRAALVRTASSLRKLHAVDTDAEQALATTPPAQADDEQGVG